MKKIVILFTLVLALFVSAFPEGTAYGQDSVYEGDAGYIVKITSPSGAQVRLMENLGLEEIYEESGLFRADTLSDVKKLGASVEYYERDELVTLFATTDDPRSRDQWALGNIEIGYAWDEGLSGSGVRVAIIDSGINTEHEDFAGTAFTAGLNVVDGSGDIRDTLGHGTAVAGVIAAVRNNRIGIAGLCDDVVIIPIKCFEDSGVTNASYIVSAIYRAVNDFNADVINLSLGTPSSMRSMAEAVEYADSRDVILVAAVGNEGGTELSYPAAYDSVIGVGAIDRNNRLASFSRRNNSVFAVAPGVDIVGLGYSSTRSYLRWDGTSFSAPHVTAAAAMLKQAAPEATGRDFKDLLSQSSIRTGSGAYNTSYGFGRLNIRNFVEAMKKDGFIREEALFHDVIGHWAEKSIEFCVERGYFTGVSPNIFAPEMTMTRAMFVTVLSRMSGENISGFRNDFTDVPAGAWYAQASAWGAARGIVTGVGPGRFDPDGNVTREQMATFLYRFAALYGFPDMSSGGGLSAFSDQNNISDYARGPMAWAVDKGLINGRTPSTLAPNETSRRSEVAAIISRFYERTALPFAA